jgi:hypothetical protein
MAVGTDLQRRVTLLPVGQLQARQSGRFGRHALLWGLRELQGRVGEQDRGYRYLLCGFGRLLALCPLAALHREDAGQRHSQQGQYPRYCDQGGFDAVAAAAERRASEPVPSRQPVSGPGTQTAPMAASLIGALPEQCG